MLFLKLQKEEKTPQNKQTQPQKSIPTNKQKTFTHLQNNKEKQPWTYLGATIYGILC